jgi:hypothetical protein
VEVNYDILKYFRPSDIGRQEIFYRDEHSSSLKKNHEIYPTQAKSAGINLPFFLISSFLLPKGPRSSVGIATELRAGRSGDRFPVGARFSAHVHTGPGAHPASCTMGTGSFPRVKSGRGVLLTTHPLLVPRSWKSTAIPLPSLWVTPGL